MLAEDVQRKIWMGALIGGLVLGLLFLFWAVFLNRGTIIIKSKAPYTLLVDNLRSENCTTDECTTIVAPGDYSITIQKLGYKPFTKNITVPLGAPYQDNIVLQFIPVISESTKTENDIFPPDPRLTAAQLEQLGITKSASAKLFFNEAKNIVTFVSRNPENFNQTLYLSTIESGKFTDPDIVTSFLRDLQNYVVVPSPSGKKIAIIDQASGQSTLYVVNREAKNRASLFSYPMIRDIVWLPGSDDFLFQAREKNNSPEAVFLYRWDDGKITQLELRAPLSAVAAFDKNRIIAVTNQKLPSVATNTLEGQLVPLGENQSTIEVSAGQIQATKTPAYAFVDYSLIANQARLMTMLTKDPFPSQLKLADDKKSVYFLQGEKVFQLRFEE